MPVDMVVEVPLTGLSFGPHNPSRVVRVWDCPQGSHPSTLAARPWADLSFQLCHRSPNPSSRNSNSLRRACSSRCSRSCGICGHAAPAAMRAMTCMPCCHSRNPPGLQTGILVKRMRRGGICRRRRCRRAISVHGSSVEQASACRRARDVYTGRRADLSNNESIRISPGCGGHRSRRFLPGRH